LILILRPPQLRKNVCHDNLDAAGEESFKKRLACFDAIMRFDITSQDSLKLINN